MTTPSEPTPRVSASSKIGAFKAYLAAWIAVSIGAGLVLGKTAPGLFSWLQLFEVGHVNLAVAALVWLMIFPTMVKVDFSRVGQGAGWIRGLVLTVTTNWLVKPLSMAVLATYFLTNVFSAWIPTEDSTGYVAGLILLGVAPCTGMVFVWSRLTGGDSSFTVVQVSINDLILLVAFAPIVAFLLGVADVSIPWTTLALATVVFVVFPLVAGMLVRARLLKRGGEEAVTRFADHFSPLTSWGLLVLVMVLFGLQAEQVLEKPSAVFLISVPLFIQSYGIFAFAFAWAWWWRLPMSLAAPAALIGTSNFFELAIAVAIGLFGVDSPAALATVVGVLVEVPVMLSLVSLANRLRGPFDARAAVAVGARADATVV